MPAVVPDKRDRFRQIRVRRGVMTDLDVHGSETVGFPHKSGTAMERTKTGVRQIAVDAAEQPPARSVQHQRPAGSLLLSKALAERPTLTAALEDPSAVPMWLFYKAHRSKLITDIGLYRAQILAALHAGVDVEEAFAPYLRSNSIGLIPAGTQAAARPAWPWRRDGALRSRRMAAASSLAPARLPRGGAVTPGTRSV
jgi:hypothetical protein